MGHDSSAHRKKILHVLWSGSSGGAERYVQTIVNRIDKDRFKQAICFLSEGGVVAEEVRSKGITICIIGMKTGLSLSHTVTLRNIITRYKPDIIHCHIRNYLVNAVICAIKTKRIYYEHGADLIGTEPLKDIVFYHTFARRYDVILTNSDYMKQNVLKYYDHLHKVVVHPIGVDTDKFHPPKNKARLRKIFNIPVSNRVIGAVCRLVPQKGLDDFMKIAENTSAQDPNTTFIIAGAGPVHVELEKKAQKGKIDIRLLGERSDIVDVLGSMDIFLMTSRWEPYGMAVVEALACGVPVIGFKVGGTAEIVEKGGGMLMQKRDANILCEYILNILNDDSAYMELREQAIVNARKHYDINRTLNRLEALYDSI
jgi:glycosyltransferase involved in cell wall biosynthesis